MSFFIAVFSFAVHFHKQETLYQSALRLGQMILGGHKLV